MGAGSSLDFSKDNEIEFLRHEIKRLEGRNNCSSCGEFEKEMVLPCGHLLCEKCV